MFTTNDMTVNKFEPDISEEKRETGRETGLTTFGGGMMGGGGVETKDSEQLIIKLFLKLAQLTHR